MCVHSLLLRMLQRDATSCSNCKHFNLQCPNCHEEQNTSKIEIIKSQEMIDFIRSSKQGGVCALYHQRLLFSGNQYERNFLLNKTAQFEKVKCGIKTQNVEKTSESQYSAEKDEILKNSLRREIPEEERRKKLFTYYIGKYTY